MKNIIASLLVFPFIFLPYQNFSQSVGIGTITPNASAQLDINSTSKGLLIPRMTTLQRDAITNPANGLMIYNSSTTQYDFFNGSRWQSVSAVPKGAIVLGEKNYDSTFLKEGYVPQGFLAQDYTKLEFGDTTIAANSWYLGNRAVYQNETAPTINNIACTNGTQLFVFEKVNSGNTALEAAINIYDPVTDKWIKKPVTDANITTILIDAIKSGTIIWTGTEFLLWGGGNALYSCSGAICFYTGLSNKGVRYNPTTDAWSTISTINAPIPRYYHKTVWTGTEMIVWGGKDRLADSLHSFQNTGARYNPATDTWTSLSIPPSFGGRQDFTMTYVANKVIIWGGKAVEPKTRTVTVQCASGSTLSLSYYDSVINYKNGMIYNTTNNTWTTMNNVGAPSARYSATAEWYVDRLIITGGTNTSHTFSCGTCIYIAGFPQPCAKTVYKDSILKSGAQYNPVSNVWSPIADAPRPFTLLSSYFDNEQYIYMYGSDSTLMYEPSADDWFLQRQNPLPVFKNTLQRQLVWPIGTTSKIALPGTDNFTGKADLYNYKTIPVTLPEIKNFSVQTGAKFYLYKKE